MNLKHVVNELKKACELSGSQKAFAKSNGVSEQYVSDVLHYRREPGKAILDALGLAKEISYVRKCIE